MILNRRAFLALPALMLGCSGARRRTVLYCAQDREFAQEILELFHQQTGEGVVPKFDTEANKSVSLYREIVAEKQRPRCDVFWNNEIVSTIRLQNQGLLQPYESPSAKAYPDWARADDHTWTAFASRARILLVNNRLVPREEQPRSLLELTDPRWRDRVVMARPMFGTTATHVACLFEVLGKDQAEEFLSALKANGLQLAPGNKQVAEWVAQGQTVTGKPVALGLTDTDDAIQEVKAGRDVSILFPDRQGRGKMGTLFIPNTLCIPKNCPNPEGARTLIDFLLSAEIEKRLAEGPSAQIPLNPEVHASLPPQILVPSQLKVMQVDWSHAAQIWDQAQSFVTKTFAG